MRLSRKLIAVKEKEVEIGRQQTEVALIPTATP